MALYQVGDSVDYYSKTQRRTFTGVVKRIVSRSSSEEVWYCVFFGEAFAQAFNTSQDYDMHEIWLVPSLSKEKRIQQKIRVLWNKSKYVKKNPQYAY